MRSIGRATLPLRIAGVAGIVLGVLAVLGTIFIPHNMTCDNSGDCRTANDLLFAVAMLCRYLATPFAAAGTFALGLSLLTAAFRPPPAPDADPGSDTRSEPRQEAIMTTETSGERILAPARALWTFAGVVFAICAAASVVVSLPLSQIAFGSTCDENGCSYGPLYTVLQIVGFLAPSMMIAALMIAALGIVASTINRHGGIRIPATERSETADAPGHDDADAADPDDELDELLGSATDDLGRARSRGPATWRGGDLTPFMRPPGHDGAERRD